MLNSSEPTTQDTQLLPVVTAVYLGLLATMGVIGNVLVVATVARMSQMHHMTYILVGNLSAVGLLNCVLTIPMHVTHMLTNDSLWEDESNATCKVLAHVNFGLVLCILINSAAIAVCRYRTVTATHSIRNRTESTVRILKLIFFIWSLPTLVAISASPFLGFNSLLSDCFFLDLKKAFWYMNMALASPALVSAVCMLIAHTLIIKKVRESRIKISNLCHKPVSVTDNAMLESREERTVSESEQRRGDVHTASVEGVPGPSNMGGIRIFTTMIPDESVHVPSVSDTSKNLAAPAPDLSKPDTTKDLHSPVAGSSQDSPCYLQAPLPNHSTDMGMMTLISSKGMETLSVPSRSRCCLSDDGVNITSMDSAFSGSAASMTQNELVRRRSRRVRKEVRLTVHLFLAFVLFCFLYLPLCFAHLLHTFLFLGKEVWLVFYTLALSFGSNAWLVYALLNHDFRRAFRAFLRGQRSF